MLREYVTTQWRKGKDAGKKTKMKNKKEKLFMLCDWDDGKARGAAWDIGIEYMGNCKGRILKEDGTEIGRHHSSTYGWLRLDLIRKLDVPANYEIIDLIEKEVPEQFRLTQDEITHYFKKRNYEIINK